MRSNLRGMFAGMVLGMAGPLASQAAEMPAADTVTTDQGDLVIQPFHHASMLMKWNGLAILVDPAPRMGSGGAGDITAEYTAAGIPDVILITHEHPDHFNVDILDAVSGDETTIVAPQSATDKMPDDLKDKTKVMANGDTMSVEGITIDAVPAYNTTKERTKFHPQGRDNGYILTLGGKRIYIAGDTEGTPEMRALTNIDAAFLPMNLPYTMDIDHAADAVKAFKPAIVYPYHYADSDVNAFKAMVGNAADVRLLKWY
jgi:L-ascorbate metabolism protein UlaG (beta-lactamase superfamily)